MKTSTKRDFYTIDKVQFITAMACLTCSNESAMLSIYTYKTNNANYMISHYNGNQEQITYIREKYIEDVLQHSTGDIFSDYLDYLATVNDLPFYTGLDTRSYHFTTLDKLNIDIPKLKETLNRWRFEGKTIKSATREFMYTKYFRRFFFSKVRSTYNLSADKVTKNQLTDEVCYEILNDFVNWQISSVLNIYQFNTGGLEALLQNSFSENYVLSKRALPIINEKFAMTEDAEGEMYDQKETVNKKADTLDFDFNTDVNKIYKATQVLFSHKSQAKNKSEIFYDLLSYYQAKVSEANSEEAKEFLRRIAPRYTIKMQVDYKQVSTDRNTIETKLRHRKQFADVYFPIIQHGINPSEIYTYYENAVRQQDLFLQVNPRTQKVKNGGDAIFSSQMIGKQGDFSDSQKHYVIIQGFLAMRRLLNYCHANNISINSISSELFRSAKMELRYYSLDEHLKYKDYVEPLVREANSNDLLWMNLRGNDTVWAELKAHEIVREMYIDKYLDNPIYMIEQARKAKSVTFAKDICSKLCMEIANDVTNKMNMLEEKMSDGIKALETVGGYYENQLMTDYIDGILPKLYMFELLRDRLDFESYDEMWEGLEKFKGKQLVANILDARGSWEACAQTFCIKTETECTPEAVRGLYASLREFLVSKYGKLVNAVNFFNEKAMRENRKCDEDNDFLFYSYLINKGILLDDVPSSIFFLYPRLAVLKDGIANVISNYATSTSDYSSMSADEAKLIVLGEKYNQIEFFISANPEVCNKLMNGRFRSGLLLNSDGTFCKINNKTYITKSGLFLTIDFALNQAVPTKINDVSELEGLI